MIHQLRKGTLKFVNPQDIISFDNASTPKSKPITQPSVQKQKQESIRKEQIQHHRQIKQGKKRQSINQASPKIYQNLSIKSKDPLQFYDPFTKKSKQKYTEHSAEKSLKQQIQKNKITTIQLSKSKKQQKQKQNLIGQEKNNLNPIYQSGLNKIQPNQSNLKNNLTNKKLSKPLNSTEKIQIEDTNTKKLQVKNNNKDQKKINQIKSQLKIEKKMGSNTVQQPNNSSYQQIISQKQQNNKIKNTKSQKFQLKGQKQAFIKYDSKKKPQKFFQKVTMQQNYSKPSKKQQWFYDPYSKQQLIQKQSKEENNKKLCSKTEVTQNSLIKSKMNEQKQTKIIQSKSAIQTIMKSRYNNEQEKKDKNIVSRQFQFNKQQQQNKQLKKYKYSRNQIKESIKAQSSLENYRILQGQLQKSENELEISKKGMNRVKAQLQIARQQIFDKNRSIVQMRYEGYPRSIIMSQRFQYWSLQSNSFYNTTDPVGEILAERKRKYKELKKENNLEKHKNGIITRIQSCKNFTQKLELLKSKSQVQLNISNFLNKNLLQKLRTRISSIRKENQSFKRGLLVKI